MLTYYLRLSLVSITRHWVLSTLMILAIAVGIGVCMTMVTVNYVMGSDPIPAKSAQLFYVQLDSWDPNNPADNDDPSAPPDQVTYLDAMALMQAQRTQTNAAYRQTATAGAALVLHPDNDDAKPFIASVRTGFADFFPMFDTPFLYGTGWTAEDDDHRAPVMVLSKSANERLFGGGDSVGKNVRTDNGTFRVVGVLDEWAPIPRFYDITTGPFDDVEDVFIPFNLIAEHKLPRRGNTNCWKPSGDGYEAFLNSECVWIQFWAELRNAEEKREYQALLDNYVSEQKQLGRFQRPSNNQLSTVTEWMDKQQVVQREARIMLVVGALFLAVCLLNTIGLLLSKFVGKAPEIGLRRALGASRGTLFLQYLVESVIIGTFGGMLGVLLTWFGLRGILALFGPLVENLVRMDWVMVAAAVALAIVAAVLAGLYPTWRACQIEPAGQLKSQ